MVIALAGRTAATVTLEYERYRRLFPNVRTAWRDVRSFCITDAITHAVVSTSGPAGSFTLRSFGATRGSRAEVGWERASETLRVGRDDLGVADIFYAAGQDSVLVADSLEHLAHGRAVDAGYVMHFVANGFGGIGQTVWKGVRAVPAGAVVEWRDGRLRTLAPCRAFATPIAGSQRELVEGFRQRVVDAVDAVLPEDGDCWADLSGGHDSSTVACVAAGPHRGRGRLRGCVTLCDSLGGDESAFAASVVERYELDWIRIHDPWPWRSDGIPPPRTDAPSRDYPFWSRDREIEGLLLGKRASRLLSGVGPDVYLPLTPAYAADMFWRGDIIGAAALLGEWTCQHRSRFWRTWTQHVALPMLPSGIQARWLRRRVAPPRWLRRSAEAFDDFLQAMTHRDVISSWPGRIGSNRVNQRMAEIQLSLRNWRTFARVEVVHPLLDADLVRYALGLPRELRTCFSSPKPVLRLAMRGTVPDAILERKAKGSLVLPRVCWAFGRERTRLKELLKRSVLADIGVIEPGTALECLDDCAQGRGHARHLYFALSLDTWLTARTYGGSFLTA